jgi:hypothetical protein
MPLNVSAGIPEERDATAAVVAATASIVSPIKTLVVLLIVASLRPRFALAGAKHMNMHLLKSMAQYWHFYYQLPPTVDNFCTTSD